MEIIDLSPNGQARAEPVRHERKKPARPSLELEDLYCVLQVNPNDSLTALELARRLDAGHRGAEALKILQNVARIDSRFETVMALGMIEYKMEMEKEAFRHLQEALLIGPGPSFAMFEIFKTLGNIFVRRGDFDSAEDSYNKAFRIQPDSDALLVNLGALCIQRSQWDEALQRFRVALQINSASDRAWVGLAIGHRMKGDLELAWGNLEAALEYNPLNEVALTLALDWGPANGKEPRVLELLRKFLVQGGWNECFSLAFAWLTWRWGEADLAVLELERLLAVNPGNSQGLQLALEMRAAP